MSVRRIRELQEATVSDIAIAAPDGWDRVEIHYEYYPVQGEVLEKHIANAFVGDAKQEFDLSLDLADRLIELRGATDAAQGRPWDWVEITVHRDGRYRFDVNYGVPPLAAEALRYEDR